MFKTQAPLRSLNLPCVIIKYIKTDGHRLEEATLTSGVKHSPSGIGHRKWEGPWYLQVETLNLDFANAVAKENAQRVLHRRELNPITIASVQIYREKVDDTLHGATCLTTCFAACLFVVLVVKCWKCFTPHIGACQENQNEYRDCLVVASSFPWQRRCLQMVVGPKFPSAPIERFTV